MAEYARVLSQAHGSVLIAVGLVTTTAAVKGALPEVEPLADGPARAAAACAGVEAVGYGERCAVEVERAAELPTGTINSPWLLDRLNVASPR